MTAIAATLVIAPHSSRADYYATADFSACPRQYVSQTSGKEGPFDTLAACQARVNAVSGSLACARYSCQSDSSDSDDSGVSIPSLAGLSAQQQLGIAGGMLGAAMIFQGLSQLANQQQQAAPAQSATPPQAVAAPAPPPQPQVTVPAQSPAAIQDASLDPAQMRLLGLSSASSASGVGNHTTYSTPAPPPSDSVAAQKNALLGELRPLDGQPAQPAPQFGSAADQLCQAAGQAAGCLSGNIATPPSSPAGATGASGPANLNGPNENMSAAARTPFDTAGTPGAANGGTPPAPVSDTPAVTVSNPNAKVALLSPPPLPPPANTQIVAPPAAELRSVLQTENKNLQGDACIRLVALRKQLEGLRGAVERIQGIHETSEEDRAEFEKKIGETTKDAWKHLADGHSSLVEADIDGNVEKLNEDAITVLNTRINTASTDPNVIVQGVTKSDAAFLEIVKKRRDLKWDNDYAMRYIDTFSTGLDAVDLTDEHDFGKRALQGSSLILSTLLGDPVVQKALGIGSGYATFNTLANLYVNAGLDLTSQWESYKALDNLNSADAKYLAASTSLQKNIKTTVDKIKATQAELAHSSRSCPSEL